MSWTSARRTVLVLIALGGTAASTSSATAATTTLQPSPDEARTFATTNGGWSSAVDYNGLVCIPGVTCPTATPSYRSTGGSGGATDGHLRNTFGTLLGVLSTTTINWTSPSFVAPTGTDATTLRFNVRPQIASLLAIGSVSITPTLVDVADGTRTTALTPIPLTAASASFSERSVVVPASAVVPGRTYQVRIGTSVTTNVSAVTSGNVDIDDVELRLTDLALPIDLTASVPATGPSRVTGSVDTAGSDTDVVVDYGTTTAYGSTTAPVELSGSISGSQPFTIPLPDLTPGTTYNYRVRATNADGEVSTDNASFVAASLPSDAPPTISGAGNTRTRTAAFARASDVTDAEIELLDGDGELVDSYPDVDGDGSVVFTLPDADGTYGVRLVRSNSAGQSSTSVTVPVVLDRVAPDVTNLDITVSPTDSNVATRTVSFARPLDATSVSAQVINADDTPVGLAVPVTGNSASVTLGPGDGSYRVRLTLRDTAGNAVDATSGTATLDTAAPTPGPAPTVTGDGNSRERTVAFTRDPTAETAIVEILDGDGDVLDTVPVPTGGSATVTLPDEDGDYGIRVRQSDAAGNAASTLVTDVSLDRVAPDLSGLDLELTPTLSNDRDRTVTIVRPTDAASVTAQVIDAEGAPVGDPVTIAGTSGTVTLGTVEGSYRVVVTVVDAAGNDAQQTSAPATLDATPPSAGPEPTVTGDDNARIRTVEFTRDPSADVVAVEIVDADGDLVDTIPVTSGASTPVTLPDADGSYGIRVRQTDAAGNAAVTSTADVVLDRVAPDVLALALTVTPAVSNDRSRTVRIVRPSDAAAVTAQVVDADDELVGSVVVIDGTEATVTLGDEDGGYRVRVAVADAAGNGVNVTSDAVTLDTAAPDAGPEPTVGGEDNSRERTVTFDRDPTAETVAIEILDGDGTVIDTVPVPTGNSATVTLPDADGSYGIRVRQTDAAGNDAASPTASVTLDLAGPDPGPAPEVSGGPDSLTVTFVRASDAATVTVEVRDATGSLVQSITVPTGNSATFRLPDAAGLYTIRVVQTDALGNSRTTAETTVERAPTRPGTPPGTTPPGATPPPTADPVACAKPATVLTQVRRQGSRVRISGFTTLERGTAVRIVDVGGKRVGTATVGTPGTFSARVTVPRTAAQRARVGYRAIIGRLRSPAVKLGQVNTLRTVARSGDTVTLRGRVTVRDGSRFRTVAAYGGSGDCPTTNKRLETIGTPTINRRTGAYTLRVRVPASDRLVIKTRATVGAGNYHSTHTVSGGR